MIDCKVGALICHHCCFVMYILLGDHCCSELVYSSGALCKTAVYVLTTNYKVFVLAAKCSMFSG